MRWLLNCLLPSGVCHIRLRATEKVTLKVSGVEMCPAGSHWAIERMYNPLKRVNNYKRQYRLPVSLCPLLLSLNCLVNDLVHALHPFRFTTLKCFESFSPFYVY